MIRVINSIKSSITRKLVISYLFIILIPLTISGIFLNYYTNRAMKKEIIYVIDNSLKQLDRSITEKVDSCKLITNIIRQDKYLANIIQTTNAVDLNLIDAIVNDLSPRFEAMRIQSRYIYKLRVIHGNPRIPMFYDLMYYDEMVNNGKLIEKLKKLKPDQNLWADNIYIENIHEENTYEQIPDSRKRKVLSIYRTIYYERLDKIVGIIQIDLLEDTILEPLKNIELQDGEAIVLTDKAGKLLFSSKEGFSEISPDLLNNQGKSMDIKVNGAEYTVEKLHVDSIDSWLMIYIPQKIISNNSYRFIIMVVLFCGLVTLGILAFFLSRLLLGKLTKLTVAINRIKQGKFETRVNIKSNDEIGILAADFNEMTEQIKSLMDNVRNSNIAEKEAIYKALENQISPHFLCNALDMVRMTAVVQNNHEVSRAMELVISYFMYNISRKEKYVSIKDELMNVTDYIELHNMIKENRINYNINVSPEISGRLNKYYILKFILQPIVENSIVHGFKGKHEDCFILINVSCDNMTISITLEDNGSGMDQQRVLELMKYLDINISDFKFATSGSGNGIGLRNINKRLLLNYGGGFGLEIESCAGFGTCTTVKVPVINDVHDL